MSTYLVNLFKYLYLYMILFVCLWVCLSVSYRAPPTGHQTQDYIHLVNDLLRYLQLTIRLFLICISYLDGKHWDFSCRTEITKHTQISYKIFPSFVNSCERNTFDDTGILLLFY